MDAYWDGLLLDLTELALMNRENPSYGPLTDLRHALHDAVSEFGDYAKPLFMQKAVIAEIAAGIRGVYERALRRSDAAKKSWGLHAAC